MRRVNYRRRVLVGILAFAAVFSFVLLKKFNNGEIEVGAANLANFDPGYIMSDYQMGNYNSMTEAEIQSWLTSKNSCPNTDYNLYLRLSASTSVATWHFANGHFVCISEELFGDGEVIGTGETAAHIIWQAAQDYHINPQVLLVLLQKENSLITDDLPNSWNYRTATGYGCPDTAACSSKYYGFKNQIRNAAALFHEVLSGGWTNYPLGENYIRYSPHCDSGTVVNIRSLATSALYRYTPYQPNAAVLAAGYGVVPGDACAAYGNRNFYSFFEDWFGGITMEFNSTWQEMIKPRVMKVSQTTMMVNPVENKVYDGEFAELNKKYYFTTKIDIKWNGKIETCLRTMADTEVGIDRCIIMSRMSEVNEPYYTVEEIEKESFDVINDTHKYNIKSGTIVQDISVAQHPTISFSAKIVFEGEVYYQTTYDYERNNEYYIPAKDLKDIVFEQFLYPRNMEVGENTDFINIKTGEVCKSVKSGYVKNFVTKTKVDDIYYYRTDEDTEEKSYCVVPANVMTEAGSWTGLKEYEIAFVDFLYPREMAFKKNTYSINVINGISCERLYTQDEIANFTTKIKIGPNYYYRTEEETVTGVACVLKSSGLREL